MPEFSPETPYGRRAVALDFALGLTTEEVIERSGVTVVIEHRLSPEDAVAAAKIFEAYLNKN